jgi:8-oxo-dGTP pyrophosphatase MutT (NUDIX family)
MTRIRNSAKAIIRRDGCLLAIHKADDLGGYYILPGGGQHYGEPLADTLRREVKEETALDVKVGDVLFIRDYISSHHEFAETEKDCHQVEFMFSCEVEPDTVARLGDTPDDGQIDVHWLPLDRLMDYRLYPLTLRPRLMNLTDDARPVYLGDIN